MPYPIQNSKKYKIKLQNLSVFIYCGGFTKKASIFVSGECSSVG